jgi:hypothetical protein
VSLSLLWVFVGVALFPPVGHVPAATAGEEDPPSEAQLDSLLLKVQRYKQMIADIRDSLSEEEPSREWDRQRGHEALDRALEQFGGAISSLSRELSDLDLDIEDQTISLRDRDGGGVQINIPEDLGEQISKGISSLTEVILNELPDTISWSGEAEAWPEVFKAPERRPTRRVLGGGAVKIWDDILIRDDEEVRGNVVSVFGDAVVQGVVEGDVIVVLGDLEVSETAEITGQIVTILGRLDQAEEAQISGGVVVLDPYVAREIGGLRDLFAGGWVAFLAKQMIFLLVAFLVVFLIVIFPSDRQDVIQSALTQNPGACFGYGVLVALLGHIGLALLSVLLVLTVIGIPLAVVLAFGVILLGLLSVAVVALQVGRRVVQVLNLSWQQDWLVTLLGLFVLHALNLIGGLIGFWSLLGPLALLFGILGLGVKLLAYFFGFGALVVSRFGTKREAVAVPAPVQAS